MFTIEKRVPMPASRLGRRRESKYPFREMGVGDSFYMPMNGYANYESMCAALRGLARNQGVRAISIRRDGKGYRVWRVRARR